ncbi:MAG: hypothetical protein ACI9MF_001039, partial [Gammaproteobacteria bacterium]
ARGQFIASPSQQSLSFQRIYPINPLKQNSGNSFSDVIQLQFF